MKVQQLRKKIALYIKDIELKQDKLIELAEDFEDEVIISMITEITDRITEFTTTGENVQMSMLDVYDYIDEQLEEKEENDDDNL